MPKLVIPTRNRPASLDNVLGFIARFFPGTSIVIADGSIENYRPLNQQAVSGRNRDLDIDYRAFEPSMPFFDRILDVLTSLPDETVVMGADDDYPQLDVLAQAEEVLLSKPDHVSAFGATIHLKLTRRDHLMARLDHAHPVTAPTAARRANFFAEWPYSTTYAVTRRAHLVERYERAKHSFLVGFYDFKTGIHDAMAGKLAVVPGISYLSTHNFAHSYLRAEDGLVFLRHADEVLGIVEQFRQDLAALDGLGDDEASRLATRLIKKRISALVDLAPHRRPGFETSRVYQLPVVQQQVRDFYALFSGASSLRSTMEPRLRYIVDALLKVCESQDNQGEAATYETLDAQASPAIPSATADKASSKRSGETMPVESARNSMDSPPALDPTQVTKRSLIDKLIGRPTAPAPVPPLHFDVNLASLVRGASVRS